MPRNATSGREVFVIDDDARTREALSNGLQKSGYDVISFADGAALLSYAKTRTPAGVFIEVDATDRSGFEVLKKLRSENCPAPIFVTSAHGAIPLAVDLDATVFAPDALYVGSLRIVGHGEAPVDVALRVLATGGDAEPARQPT